MDEWGHYYPGYWTYRTVYSSVRVYPKEIGKKTLKLGNETSGGHLLCSVEVKNYINKMLYTPDKQRLEHRGNQYINGSTAVGNQGDGYRKNWSDAKKDNNMVVLENYGALEYKVILKNENPSSVSSPVYTLLEDIVPETADIYYVERSGGSAQSLDPNDTRFQFAHGINNDPNNTSQGAQEDGRIRWPGSTHYSADGYQMVSINSGETIEFTIRVWVRAQTAKNPGQAYYNTGVGATSKVSIYPTYYRAKMNNLGNGFAKFEKKSVRASTDSEPNAHNTKENTSHEFYILKQYNVTVDTYIDNVQRNNKAGLESGEFLVDNNSFYPSGDQREKKPDTTKKANPVYAENGDYLTLKMKVRYHDTDYKTAGSGGKSSEQAPYYQPTELEKVRIKVDLPEDAVIDKCYWSNMTYPGGSEPGQTHPEGSSPQVEDANGNVVMDGFNSNGWYKAEYTGEYIDVWHLWTNRTATITIKLWVNTNKDLKKKYGDPYEFKTTIEDVYNFYGTKYTYNTAQKPVEIESADYWHIKEYNIGVDKFISKVEHVENRNGQKVTFESNTARRGTIDVDSGGGSQDSTKNNSPVYVEYGDLVSYTIVVYNTTKSFSEYVVKRDDGPYKQPQWITVDLEDILPNKCEVKNAEVTAGNGLLTSYDASGGVLKLNKVRVEANSRVEITVQLIVEELLDGTIETNKVKIVKDTERNINDFRIINNSKRLGQNDEVLDKYILNNYRVQLDEYISDYRGEMYNYNVNHGYINAGSEQGPFGGSTTNYPSNNPLATEKYETLRFGTKVTNIISGGTDEGATGSWEKYNTRIRPTDVKVTIDVGLDVIGYQVIWRHNGSDIDVTGGVRATETNIGNNKVECLYTITDENIILSPGDYIVYYTEVQVMESNFYTGMLQSKSEIITCTNINRTAGTSGKGLNFSFGINPHDRVVYSAPNQNPVYLNIVTFEDFVYLKQLVMAGQVWLDTSRNGFSDNGETGKDDITAILYFADGKEVTRAKTRVTSDGNGFYTFGRQDKTKEYYVEFEYNGLYYKATEVYGGNNSGTTDGRYTLENDAIWRQGYGNELPQTRKPSTIAKVGIGIAGKKEYMTDSNAYEFDNIRNDLDYNNATIGNNKTYSADTIMQNQDGAAAVKGRSDLVYDKNGHVSTLTEAKGEIMTSRSFIIQNFNTTVNSGLDNTNTLYLTDYNGYHNENPETEYLKFINLGLVKREEIDLSIESDVKCVKNTINGEEMTYDFNQNTYGKADSRKSDYDNHETAYSTVPKFDSDYKLGIYKADYNYRYDAYYNAEGELVDYKGYEISEPLELNKAGQSELTTEITYKIKIHNNNVPNNETSWGDKNDIPVDVALNEIAIYYDSKFVYNENLKGLNTTVKLMDRNDGLLKDKGDVTDRDDLEKDTKSIRVKYGYADENGNITSLIDGDVHVEQRGISPASKYETTNNPINNDYRALYISGGTLAEHYIPEGETRILEVIIPVDKMDAELARSLKLGNFPMVSEITAYTTQYNDSYWHQGLKARGKYAALIDKDSNPGNLADINDVAQYEDDTYKTSVNLYRYDVTEPKTENPTDPNAPKVDDPNDLNSDKKQNVRAMMGKVWEDARSEAKGTDGVQYLGNGIYDTSNASHENASKNPNDKTAGQEKTISGVKVKLMEVVQKANGQYYEYQARDSANNPIEFITGSDGKYMLNDYMPGFYIVRFEYGWNDTRDDNLLYNGQDYKSTAYYNRGYYGNLDGQAYATDNLGNSGNYRYFDKVKDNLKVGDNSDAQDDEIRRLNVNAYSEIMTTAQTQVFSEAKAFSKELVDNTHMYSDSTIFYVRPENQNCELTNRPYNETDAWRLGNLDFGIEYRPEAGITVGKDIKTIELVTTDGATLIKLYFEDDPAEPGKRLINKEKSIGADNVQFVQNGDETLADTDRKGKQGFVYINMDSDLLEGCTINIEYEFESTNESEVDRVNSNLYNIRFEQTNEAGSGLSAIGAVNKGYTPIYLKNATINTALEGEENYNANATAAKFLEDMYQAGTKYQANGIGSSQYKYLTRLKKPYINPTTSTTGNGTVTLAGSEYYGMYLGETYYTGNIGANDKVVDLKVDNILDYLDNNLTFNAADNAQNDRLWSTKKSEELATVLDWSTARVEQGYSEHTKDTGKYYKYNKYYDKDGKMILADDGTLLTDIKENVSRFASDSENQLQNIVNFRKAVKYGNMVDEKGIRYDTDNRSNLLMSVDSNRKGNETDSTVGNKLLSRFLVTTKMSSEEEKTTGRVNLLASKTLSAIDVEEGTALDYTNTGEVVQYRTLTGRRTPLPTAESKGGLIATGSPGPSEGGSYKPDPSIPPVDPDPSEGGSKKPEPTIPPPEIFDDKGGSKKPDPILPPPNEENDDHIMGSHRVEPIIPPVDPDVTSRVQGITESSDFTELITISPPTGLKQS